MAVSTEFFQYWYFNIPNYVLALFMWTLLGRFLLSLFIPPGWENYIWQAFCRLTDPVLRVVRFITPQAVAFLFLMPLGAFWILILRAAFTLIMLKFGLVPVIDPALQAQ